MKKLTLAISSAVVALSGSAVADISSDTQPRVRAIYIVPSDKTYNPQYEESVGKAIQHLQDYYLEQMGDGTTFFTYPDLVEVVYSDKDSAYFTQYLWKNTRAEAKEKLGAIDEDPDNTWMLYVDADRICKPEGEESEDEAIHRTIGGANAMAVLAGHDLSGLAGVLPTQVCSSDVKNGVQNTPARWVGGSGHEMAHAFYISHPPECVDDDASTICPPNALMSAGYANYPESNLLEADKIKLTDFQFFTTKPMVDRIFNYYEDNYAVFFPEHTDSREESGYYLRDYSNGSQIRERDGQLSFRLSEAGSYTTLAQSAKQFFDANIKSLNNISDSFLTTEGYPIETGESFQFTNKWKTQKLLEINNNTVWYVREIAGTGAVNICQSLTLNYCLHMENGSLEDGVIKSGWWSAQWILEQEADGYTMIRNRWKSDHYIHLEESEPSATPVGSNWYSARWKVED